MSNVNFNELQVCLDDCLAYCKKHPERQHVLNLEARLIRADHEFKQGIAISDREFTKWRNESGEEMLQWKHLANQLAALQRKLGSVNAVGFPSRRVMYWDAELLQNAVLEMIAYLRTRVDVISFAKEQIDNLERRLDSCNSEDGDSERALKSYTRHVANRASGMRMATDNIAAFRRELRRELGKTSADYKSIRWPFDVATDEPIL